MFSALTIDTHRGVRTFALADSTKVSIRAKDNMVRVYATDVVNRKAPIILDIVAPVTSLDGGILTVTGSTPGGDPVTVTLVLG